MNTKLKGKIIAALRRLTFTHPDRNEAKNSRKVAPATFQCEECELVVYTGKKTLEKSNVLEEYPEAIKGKIYLDHKNPVIPVNGFPDGNWSWDIFIERMFCDVKGFQVLCHECNQSKTFLENELRKEYRKSKK